MRGRRKRPVLLFRDTFTSGTIANGTARTADRGVWDTVVDTGAKASLSGGDVVVSSATGNGDPRLLSARGYARKPGLAMVAELVVPSVISGWAPGFTGVAGANNLTHRIVPRPLGNAIICYEAATANVGMDKPTAGDRVKVAIIARSAGAYYLITVAGAWKLAFVADIDVSATLYPAMGVLGVGTDPKCGQYDIYDLAALETRFASDDVYLTQRLAGARTTGDTFTHAADGIINVDITALPSSGTMDLEFRRQDASNLWKVSISSAGAINLYERVAGVDTSRANGTGVAAGNKLRVVFQGSTINMFANQTQKGSTYASASNFASATAGQLTFANGASFSKVEAYPRDVTLPTGI